MKKLRIGNLKGIRWLWSRIYKQPLWEEKYQTDSTVVKVKGWRTALVDTYTGRRMMMTPCVFPWEMKMK